MPGTPPAPWLYREIGQPKPEGKATWTGGKVTLSVPYGARSYDGNRISAGFLYRPLAGDGEISARMEPAQNTGLPGATAVCLRVGLEPAAPEAQLTIGDDDVLNFRLRDRFPHTGVGEASSVPRRSTRRIPTSPNKVVDLDLRAGRLDAAAEVQARLFKADPTAAMQQAISIYQNFERVNRVGGFHPVGRRVDSASPQFRFGRAECVFDAGAIGTGRWPSTVIRPKRCGFTARPWPSPRRNRRKARSLPWRNC